MTALTAETIFIKRSILHTLRTPDALVTAIALPSILMLLFTYVFGGAIEEDGSYVNYVVPGIILLCAGFGSASVAVDVANDMQNGIIDRFRTMPLRASAVITGHVVASVLRNLLATGIVIGVGIAVGFRPDAGLLDWVAVMGLIALYILAITYLFAAIGLAASSPEAASGYGFFLMFLPYLSSAFVPVDTMPQWLRPIAEHQPLTPII
jgi:ABC-2 type transport system permease protein